jgi:acyl-homoserine lactone acylase PvdQ
MGRQSANLSTLKQTNRLPSFPNVLALFERRVILQPKALRDGILIRMKKTSGRMNTALLAVLTLLVLPCFAQEKARWAAEAARVTIVRDDCGIAHVYGKTDADAVFGMIYAQAEDDFNRVETNYLNAMGRLAEAEGEHKVYQDLRMKMFIDPEDLKKEYAASPEWLRKLMDAFADGANFYLATHPRVKPRVIRHFEPWGNTGT